MWNLQAKTRARADASAVDAPPPTITDSAPTPLTSVQGVTAPETVEISSFANSSDHAYHTLAGHTASASSSTAPPARAAAEAEAVPALKEDQPQNVPALKEDQPQSMVDSVRELVAADAVRLIK